MAQFAFARMKEIMSKTLHLNANLPADVALAAELLRDGRLVAFATETVYGLGADATSAAAVEGIFVAKERPHWDPLIVHLASATQLDLVAQVDAGLANRVAVLTERFWPGPLTLLLPRTAAIPDAVTAGRRLVGLRVPAHPAAHLLLAEAGVPVAAPSANRFGHTSPTTAAHVLADLDGRIDAVLDAGPCSIGLESTVLDPTQTPMVIYRPGAVTAAEIEGATGVPVAMYEPPAAQDLEEPAALPSPGVGMRHYAPQARLVLTEGSLVALDDEVRRSAAQDGGGQSSVGVLLPLGWALETPAVIEPWAAWDDADALAAKLFSGLRALDDRGVLTVIAPLPADGPGMIAALRDRMRKAARPQ
jgi:L-threonylcarbamoyladenylate synthase